MKASLILFVALVGLVGCGGEEDCSDRYEGKCNRGLINCVTSLDLATEAGCVWKTPDGVALSQIEITTQCVSAVSHAPKDCVPRYLDWLDCLASAKDCSDCNYLVSIAFECH